MDHPDGTVLYGGGEAVQSDQKLEGVPPIGAYQHRARSNNSESNFIEYSPAGQSESGVIVGIMPAISQSPNRQNKDSQLKERPH